MSKIINPKTDLNYFYSIFPLHNFFILNQNQNKSTCYMGVYAYQAADWSFDVRHSTMFGYVTKNKPRLSPGNHSFYR